MDTMKSCNNSASFFKIPRGSSVLPRLSPAFTLIELLVVIGIIGLLASLTVGLTSVASKKSKESRVKAELNQLVTAIETYRSVLGFYPPDNPGMPSTNSLFYELSGTVYNPAPPGTFTVAGMGDQIGSDQTKVFGRAGFANSQLSLADLKYTTEFKPSQYKEARIGSSELMVLAVPVKGHTSSANTYRGNFDDIREFQLLLPGKDNNPINPWLYDASSRSRHNADGFDLWAEVIIGRNIVRFSNWEREPAIIGAR
jgi:prepilin-type N-terminal cleavage/methylation domain-containing protein